MTMDHEHIEALLAATPKVFDKDDPVNNVILAIMADELLKFSQRLADIGANREQINDALTQVLPAFEAARKRKLDHLHRLLDICPPSRAVH
jgi:hypothetical protein